MWFSDEVSSLLSLSGDALMQTSGDATATRMRPNAIRHCYKCEYVHCQNELVNIHKVLHSCNANGQSVI